MTLSRFIDEVADETERRYDPVLVNQNKPAPIERMVRKLFVDQPVDVAVAELSAIEEDSVVLLADGAIVATSPMERLEREILFVNSDRFKTGRGHLENLDLPSVLTEMEDVVFHLRGYPHSDTEKLILIALSRHLERLALANDAGRLRSAF
ncbi:MAG: hypothetical protein ABEJ67_01225 [Halanaeroarchaeum sp.]